MKIGKLPSLNSELTITWVPMYKQLLKYSETNSFSIDNYEKSNDIAIYAFQNIVQHGSLLQKNILIHRRDMAWSLWRPNRAF